jgi:HNH endonuclease/NUMOD4 motif-containing protein/dATP/dGTP diphosphohydrolase
VSQNWNEVTMGEARAWQTKDSGKRVDFESGMRRDTQDGKPRWDLLFVPGMPYEDQPLNRVAALMQRGAEKYGDNNWTLADSEEELIRFKASAARHFAQWFSGETDEDHAAAVWFNVAAAEYLKWKLEFEGEEWRPIPGYEGYYEASDFGRVRSVDHDVQTVNSVRHYKGKVLSAPIDPSLEVPYRQVVLQVAGRRRTWRVHQLVAQAFHGSAPEGHEVCHTNGDSLDNRASNLRWGTRSENIQDVIKHGRHNWVNAKDEKSESPLAAFAAACNKATSSFHKAADALRPLWTGTYADPEPPAHVKKLVVADVVTPERSWAVRGDVIQRHLDDDAWEWVKTADEQDLGKTFSWEDSKENPNLLFEEVRHD